ncbi:MAG: hypothetical protein U9Q81_16785 [Pseudomonadota bacterium]|nr:hypothetical protein [Pseudomonadota bacterium]
MFPILVGFGSALLFGLFAYGTYGLDGMTEYAWVGMVFWGLIVSASLVFIVNRKIPCGVCRLKERVRALRYLCRALAPRRSGERIHFCSHKGTLYLRSRV